MARVRLAFPSRLRVFSACGHAPDVRCPPNSAFVRRSHNPSGSSGQHLAVVNQAQDFNDLVLSDPVDDEMTRAADPAGWLSTPTQETDWIGENTLQTGNFDRSDHARVVP